MKHSWLLAMLLLVWSSSWLSGQAAPDGTPERAIQDLVLASKPEEIEKHLPVLLLDHVKTLDAEDRRAFEAALLWRQALPGEQPEVSIPEDGHAFLVVQSKDAQPFEVDQIDSVVTGSDGVLRFAMVGTAPLRMEVVVWMRFEEGEWRVREVNAGRFGGQVRFDNVEFAERFRNREQKGNESSATSTLYNLHFALQRYAETYPEIGFPDDLSVLCARAANDEASDDDSPPPTFLSAELAHNDREAGGYRFHYQLLRGGPQGAYEITARPLEFTRAGRFSYFINESGEVHQTPENREATGDDPPLGSNERVSVPAE